MKYLVGETSEGTSVFVVKGDEAVNITALNAEIGSDLTALISNPALADSVSDQISEADTVPVDSITPALPVAAPGTIICMGLNYTDHIKEGGYDIPEYPALFMRGKNSIMATGQPMVRPACSEQLDYEAELMLIVGRGGRHISEDDA